MIVKSKLTGLVWVADCLPQVHRQPGMDCSLFVPGKQGAYMETTSAQLIADYEPVGFSVEGHEALFGIISAMGDTWTVEYRRELESDAGHTWWKTRQQSGGGDFPFERFPDIPVVDFTDSDKVFDISSRNLMVAETRWDHTHLGIWKYDPLLSYLNECVLAAIPVYRLSHHVETYHRRHIG